MCCDYTGYPTLYSQYVNTKWHLGSEKRAQDKTGCGWISTKSSADIGIHVYVRRQDAIQGLKSAEFENDGRYVLAKVEVSRFKAKGQNKFGDNEVWSRARILDVYDKYGHKLTHKFIRH